MALIPNNIVEMSRFDSPCVATKIYQNMEQGSEEGTIDTYSTVLSLLYYGTDNEDSNLACKSKPPPEPQKQRPVTYAQVIRDSNISTVSQYQVGPNNATTNSLNFKRSIICWKNTSKVLQQN